MDPGGQYKYQQVIIFEEKELGRGSFGRVCKAMCDELPCAAKLLHPKLFQFATTGSEGLRAECRILHSIRHPCIVQYMDTYVQADTGLCVLLMELADESLTNFLNRCLNPLPIHLQIDLCYDIVQALAYLHANEIVHLDLTGHNVLVSSGSRAKVTDFGMMKLVRSQQYSNPHLKHMTMSASSSSYLPPEIARFPLSYSDKIDIFSFGVIMLQVVTRQYPRPSAAKVSEIERRNADIGLVSSEHILLPFTLSCLKDTDILRPPATQLCKKLKQLRDGPLYEESRQKREEALQEIDALRRELMEVQKENEEMAAELESVRSENDQLSKLISKCSENITANVENVKPPPRGVPAEYLELNDPSLLENHLEDEMDLSCPHPALWYHGNISRDAACLRLQNMLKPGAYLIRKSESDPGSFVLSFVDKQLRIFNYKISCRNSQYNVSGQSKKWFSTLQNLIGYYTRYSTVKQNQHLTFAVAPPEIIPLPTQ